MSLNLYTYCLNNPVIYIDPSGHVNEYCYYGLDDDFTYGDYSIETDGTYDEALSAFVDFTQSDEFASSLYDISSNTSGATDEQIYSFLQLVADNVFVIDQEGVVTLSVGGEGTYIVGIGVNTIWATDTEGNQGQFANTSLFIKSDVEAGGGVTVSIYPGNEGGISSLEGINFGFGVQGGLGTYLEYGEDMNFFSINDYENYFQVGAGTPSLPAEVYMHFGYTIECDDYDDNTYEIYGIELTH